ncbi:protein FAM8A1-like [Arapaima gigas]
MEREKPEFCDGDSAAVSHPTSEYCARLQQWMWQYYCGYVSWQSWLAACSPAALPSCSPQPPSCTQGPGDQWSDGRYFYYTPFSFAVPPSVAGSPSSDGGQVTGGTVPVTADSAGQQRTGNVQQPAGREYTIPSPLHRFFAEAVDFLILFCLKASVILTIMHLSGLKDLSKFAVHFIVEEMDDETSMEELQKMMLVALIYRMLVCLYEIFCIWGAGGATPGKFLLGLRVVTCDTSVLVQPNRVRVVPASNVSLSASTVRALNKNFSIAFFFPAFITLLFFQHNRTVYDIVAGTIVVKRSRA